MAKKKKKNEIKNISSDKFRRQIVFLKSDIKNNNSNNNKKQQKQQKKKKKKNQKIFEVKNLTGQIIFEVR